MTIKRVLVGSVDDLLKANAEFRGKPPIERAKIRDTWMNWLAHRGYFSLNEDSRIYYPTEKLDTLLRRNIRRIATSLTELSPDTEFEANEYFALESVKIILQNEQVVMAPIDLVGLSSAMLRCFLSGYTLAEKATLHKPGWNP